MTDGLAHWLELREPADFAARSMKLTRAVARALSTDEPLSLLDLGAGTGSNIRYLAEQLSPGQRWLAVDRNTTLLSELSTRMSSWATERGFKAHIQNGGCTIRGANVDCRVEARKRDLGVLDDHEIFAGRRLVTASALLDLVSESWLRALAAHCQAEGAVALFTITYNGHFTCRPAEAEDEMVRELMNRHQNTDKGLGGPAAGPGATACAERCFAALEYRVSREPSDWVLGPSESDVQRVLIEGWAEAAAEVAADQAPAIHDWRARRLDHVSAGRSRIVVGHEDLAAWPPGVAGL
jgi:hypothetical protein